jgi:hypothetical protein
MKQKDVKQSQHSASENPELPTTATQVVSCKYSYTAVRNSLCFFATK